MGRKTRKLKAKYEIIQTMDDKERALLSIILMNKGNISETKLKRAYLDKYTYWEMQSTEKKLSELGLFEKIGDKTSGEEFIYSVPKEHANMLLKTLVSKGIKPQRKTRFEQIPDVRCGEFSLLWYLMKLESSLENNILLDKSGRSDYGANKRNIHESLGIDEESIGFLKSLLLSLSSSTFFKENDYKKWSDVFRSPHKIIFEAFKITNESLAQEKELGREDVGKDNVDFLFDELTALKIEGGYSLKSFVSNARSILFSVNQPFRWIHFTEDNVWGILYRKLRLLGIVETSLDNNGERYLRLTNTGGFCLGKISEKKLLKKHSSWSGKFMVHPNFEVTLVSKEIHPRINLKLAMFSEPVKMDTVSVFRITKDSVREGQCFGLTTGDMTSFLSENSKGEVPQNVEYSIRDWGE